MDDAECPTLSHTEDVTFVFLSAESLPIGQKIGPQSGYLMRRFELLGEGIETSGTAEAIETFLEA